MEACCPTRYEKGIVDCNNYVPVAIFRLFERPIKSMPHLLNKTWLSTAIRCSVEGGALLERLFLWQISQFFTNSWAEDENPFHQ